MYHQWGWALHWRVHGKRYKMGRVVPRFRKTGLKCLANVRSRTRQNTHILNALDALFVAAPWFAPRMRRKWGAEHFLKLHEDD